MNERIVYESREALAKRLSDLHKLQDQGINIPGYEFDRVFFEFRKTVEREDEMKLQKVRTELQTIRK